MDRAALRHGTTWDGTNCIRMRWVKGSWTWRVKRSLMRQVTA